MKIVSSIPQLEDLAARSGFGTIYIDPPWTYRKKKKKGAASNHYRTMKLEEIVRIPVYKLANPRSHLHLWTTTTFLKRGLWLLDKWGFEYKGMFVWCKSSLGLGYYWRVSHEMLLLGVRGKMSFHHKGMKSWMCLTRGRHSEKPDVIREMIEKVSPPPRIELFARKATEGWTVFGDEIDS